MPRAPLTRHSPLPYRDGERGRARPVHATEGESPHERFLHLDRYRVEREWNRYEGTPQRDLFRQLRIRFIVQHRPRTPGWVAEIGPGPGRFSPFLGQRESSHVLVDLSGEMLRMAREQIAARPLGAGSFHFARGDGARPPLRNGRFLQVALLGNAIGFAGEGAERLIASAAALVAPGGTLLLETVASRGERSRYLHRLPPGAVGRLLAAPPRAVLGRIDREGFETQPLPRKKLRAFRSLGEQEIVPLLEEKGFRLIDGLAVAPALGSEPERTAGVRAHEASWRHLLELEETLGRRPARRAHAAALLLAAERQRSPP